MDDAVKCLRYYVYDPFQNGLRYIDDGHAVVHGFREEGMSKSEKNQPPVQIFENISHFCILCELFCSKDNGSSEEIIFLS